MNLIITNICNRNCSYCFAKEKLADDGDAGRAFISLDNVEFCLDFLQKSSVREFKILGGEPSIHPQFCEIVQRGLDRDFKIVVFTNGLWPEAVHGFISQLQDSAQLTCIVNINEPDTRSAGETERQEATLSMLGERARLGFNIYRENFDLCFVVELVQRTGIKPWLRLGLASPIVGVQNSFVPTAALPALGRRLAAQLRFLEANDVLVTFDCGFPFCMFDEQDLDVLTMATQSGFESSCGCAIDVGPDLTAWSCFPFSLALNVDLRDFKDLRELGDFFTESLAPFRSLGTFDECLSCRLFRREQCCGGCMARTIRSIEENGDPHVVEKLRRLGHGYRSATPPPNATNGTSVA